MENNLSSKLNYSIQNQRKPIDWERVKYNAFYKSYEYAETKFDPKLINLIGDKPIRDLVEQLQNTSPLNEYNEIKKNNYNTHLLKEDEPECRTNTDFVSQ